MNYAINYDKTPHGYQATFPDFPDISITAPDADSLQAQAYDALIEKLMSFIEAVQVVPAPEATPNPASVSLLPSITAKVLLHNLAVEQNRNRSWIARQMGVSRQVMTRLFNLRETTKVETIQNALDTLGCRMVITIAPKKTGVTF